MTTKIRLMAKEFKSRLEFARKFNSPEFIRGLESGVKATAGLLREFEDDFDTFEFLTACGL